MPTVIKREGGDDVIAQMEMFTFGGTLRSRPIMLTGTLIKKRGSSGKAQAATPTALIGTPSKSDSRPLNTNAGHLLGLQFGGPNVSENIVPMYASFNQHGGWKSLEDQFIKLVESEAGRVTVMINISYGGPDPRIPSGFSAGASLANGGYVGFGFFPHLAPAIEHVEIDIDEINLIKQRQHEMEKAAWTMDSKYPKLNLPPAGRIRPYAVLDYMSEVSRDLAMQSITNGREFNAYQINNILTINRVNGLGYLHSDDPQDPFAGQPLLTVAGDQGPHVDHIVAKSTMSGCNAYSNAQVMSGFGNMSKGAKKQ